ncbi:MAG: hypothetical protein ACKOY8_00905 [Verrucomicrobiota bacterium]
MRFTPMAHQEKDRHSPEAKYPSRASGFVSVTPHGGHPGGDVMTGSVRRWSSGGGGDFLVEGEVHVTSNNSKGVRARIATDRQGVLKEWIIPGEVPTKTPLPRVSLASGEELFFIVDCHGDSNSDGFQWKPVVKSAATGETVASAARDFALKPDPQSPWSALAQTLLQSNEFNFID